MKRLIAFSALFMVLGGFVFATAQADMEDEP